MQIQTLDTGAGFDGDVVVPEGCFAYEIEHVGGGGAGGVASANVGGAGGGKGGSNRWMLTNVTPGTVMRVQNGLGGQPTSTHGQPGTHSKVIFPASLSTTGVALELIAGGAQGGETANSTEEGKGGIGGNAATNTSDQGGGATFPPGWGVSQFNIPAVNGQHGKGVQGGWGGGQGDIGGGGQGATVGGVPTAGQGGYTRFIFYINDTGTPPAPTWHTLFDAAAQTGRVEWIDGGATMIFNQYVDAPISGTKARVTYSAPVGALTLTASRLGHPGVGYAFDGNDVALTVGTAAGFTVAGGTTQVSDEVDFTFDPAKGLIVTLTGDHPVWAITKIEVLGL